MDRLAALILPHADAVLGAFGLFLARTSGLVLAAPILGYGTGFSGYRVALVLALSMLLYVAHGAPLDTALLAPVPFTALVLRELLIGVFLGTLLRMITLALHVAGELVGQEMGFLVARQVDPTTGVNSTLVTSLYENLFMLALLAMNGHLWLVRGLDESFVRAPIGVLSLGGGLPTALLTLFGQMFQAGIVFAAPVLVFLFLTSIGVGVLARVVPHLNILEISFHLRVCVALIGMTVFAPLLEPSLSDLNRSFVEWLSYGLDALGS